MTHVTYTELRANLAGFMDEVCNTRAPLLVTRQRKQRPEFIITYITS